MLATGYVLPAFVTHSSADATVHLWSVATADPSQGSSFKSEAGPVLSHKNPECEDDSITCMDWSVVP